MPFTAEGKNGKEVWEYLDITRYKFPKVDLSNYELRCPDPDCHAEMMIRHGGIVTPHFAHKAGVASPDCIFVGASESEEHRAAKLQVATKLRGMPEYADAEVLFEKIVYAGAKKRKVDVFALWPDGTSVAHEIQLSRTTVGECKERTNDYYASGITSVIWWFGNDNLTDASLRQWALHECGEAGIVRFADDLIRV